MCRIIFHFFRFYYAEMHRKLWLKAPTKASVLGQMSTNLRVYFIHINFFKKPNKKITIEPKSYTAMLLHIYLIFDSSLSTCRKKMETEKWPKAADSPLPVENGICVTTNTHSISTNKLIVRKWGKHISGGIYTKTRKGIQEINVIKYYIT